MRVLSFQIFFTVFFLGALLGRQFSDERELVKFEASLEKLLAFVKADTERLVKQEKVITIIDSFNTSIPLEMKTEIAGEIYNKSNK